MSKRTTTTKRVEMEESDDDEPAEEEEEEEAGTSDTSGSMDSDNDGSDPGSQDAEAAEEEEGEAEEEEEEAIAAKRAKALDAADAAYRAAIKGDPMEAALAMRSPKRVEREMRKVTGAKTTSAAMAKLSATRAETERLSAKAIEAHAKLTARVDKLAKNDRASRVDAMISAAKTAGKAPTKDLRAQLRAHGMKHGTKALGALVAALPVVAPTAAKIAKHDERGNALGAPTTGEQAAMMDKAMAGLSPKEIEEAKVIADEKIRNMNGASRREEG